MKSPGLRGIVSFGRKTFPSSVYHVPLRTIT